MSVPYASYAAIIKTIIFADHIVTHKEREMFDRFFTEQFDLSEADITELWVDARSDLPQIHPHLDAVQHDLTARPMAMLQFLKFLNRCIISDGFNEGEYKTFEEVEKALLKPIS